MQKQWQQIRLLFESGICCLLSGPFEKYEEFYNVFFLTETYTTLITNFEYEFFL